MRNNQQEKYKKSENYTGSRRKEVCQIPSKGNKVLIKQFGKTIFIVTIAKHVMITVQKHTGQLYTFYF